MVHRYRQMGEQLGRRIPDPGAHMPHVVVGLIRKRRSKKHDFRENLKGGSKESPIKEYNPYPMDFLPGSM